MDRVRSGFQSVKDYRIQLTPEAARLISHLHPEIKRTIKESLKALQQSPYSGDDLEEELSGFKSFKPKRYRILYTVDDENKTIHIYYVGHRRDVYDHFRLLLEKLHR